MFVFPNLDSWTWNVEYWVWSGLTAARWRICSSGMVEEERVTVRKSQKLCLIMAGLLVRLSLSVWPRMILWHRSFADDLMNDIGVQLATMHMSDIIHGDLTTSNMMVRRSPSSPNQTELVSRSSNQKARFPFFLNFLFLLASYWFRTFLCLESNRRQGGWFICPWKSVHFYTSWFRSYV